MVEVEALDPFVTILGEDMVSAIRGDHVWLPKDRADKLAAANPPLVKLVQEPRKAPENKDQGPSPEVKVEPRPVAPAKKAAPRKRAAAKKAAPAAE